MLEPGAGVPSAQGYSAMLEPGAEVPSALDYSAVLEPGARVPRAQGSSALNPPENGSGGPLSAQRMPGGPTIPIHLRAVWGGNVR